MTVTLLWLPTLLSGCVAALLFALLGHGLRKMQSKDRVTAIGWWIAGAVTGGLGLWSTHYFALTALVAPDGRTELGFDAVRTGMTLVAAVGGITVLLASSRWKQSTQDLQAAVQALLLTLLWWLLLTLGVRSIASQPAASMPPAHWTALGVIAGATLVAMWLVFGSRFKRKKPLGVRQWGAAAVFGIGSGLAHGLALGGTQVMGEGVYGVSANLVQLAAAGGTLATILGLFGVLLDSRSHDRNAQLATSLSEANRRLRQQAMTDPLTGLPNRLLFEERLAAALHRNHADGDTGLAVLFIDLDGFKPINDSYGHMAGDGVLREVGRRLQALARQSDVVARVGGDEFLLLAEQPGGQVGLVQLATRVRQALEQPYTVANRVERTLSCSIGIAMYPEHGPRERLIHNADAAMYAAKNAGGGTHAFFEARMDLDKREELQIGHDLRLAIERNEFELYFHPKVDLATNSIRGSEALLRWHHPKRGLVRPDKFVPIAEQIGLIGLIGDWVIEEACRSVRRWLDEGITLYVAVNLSVHQLRQRDLAARIRKTCARHRVDPKLLIFEITESVMIDDVGEISAAIRQIADLGCEVSIDDFGAGYTALRLMLKLPVTQLKIDKSFITDMDTSEDAVTMVRAIVTLAKNLGKSVVAEGVETRRQRDLLIQMDCDEVQGYLYSKPKSSDEFLEWAKGDKGVNDAFGESRYVAPPMP